MKSNASSLSRRARRFGWIAAILAGAPFGQALAQATDIANAPLFTSGASAIKPNIMFIMDDSGSMKSAYLPDEAKDFEDNNSYGYRSWHCNGVAYNPNLVYSLPVYFEEASADPKTKPLADKTLVEGQPSLQTTLQRNLKDAITALPAVGDSVTVTPLKRSNRDGVFYDVKDIVTVFDPTTNGRFFVGTVTKWDNGKLTIKVTRVVGTGGIPNPKIGDGEPQSARYYKYKGDTTLVPDLGFEYDGNGNVKKSGTFWDECNSKIGATPGKNKFDEVVVTAASAEAQNYANWYTYYRTRMDMMKSSISLAFKGLDNRYRLGYSTISKRTAKESTDEDDSDYYNFLDIRDLGNKQKARFYQYFDNAEPTSWTPLRGALAKAGQYFANKAPSQARDPVQYSCQRNFAILSTDGYWNTNHEVHNSSPKYGPFQLDNSTYVGQQDGNPMADKTKSPPPRPMLDGGNSTKISEETWDRTEEVKKEIVTPVTVTSTRVEGGTLTTTTTTQDRTRYVYSGLWCWLGTCKETEILERRSKVDKLTETRATVSTQPGTQTVVVNTVTTTRLKRTYTEMNGELVSEKIETVSSSTVDSTVSSVVTKGEPVTTNSSTTSTPVAGAYGDWERISTVDNGNKTTKKSDVTHPEKSDTKVTPIPAGTTTETYPPSGPAVVKELSRTGPTDGPKSAPKVIQQQSSSGSENSLADVAAYYYNTDLRTSELSNCTGAKLADGSTQNVCKNNVPVTTGTAAESFGDAASWQHMTSLTLGLGLSGTLKYDPNYKKQKSGDFYDILTGQKNWPNPANGQTAENIDDLWHAAVNGRGTYFSAGDPTSLTRGLTQALDEIKAVTGAASAASTSSLQPVEGDNDIFVAQFTTVKWVGDVLSYKIDPKTGDVAKNPSWSAKAKLDQKTPADRKIYYRQPATKTLRDFDAANLKADGYEDYFKGFCSKTGANGSLKPEQCGSLNEADLAAANTAAKLVDYLRGDQTLSYYRTRDNRLGDVINASPVFVGKPPFQYTENGYQTFVSDKANRTAVVLAAANDGMLHAFSRATGDELWAFMPTFVLENLYKLADTSFANAHQFYVDGSPTMGDIYVGGAWKTIVVGGLNKGGRGYYALDVTNPGSPKLLWEFSHDDLGLTFGNPIITKDSKGDWIVAFASGYNNVSPGDGNGHLFVLDANDGTLKDKISTFTSGSTAAGTKDLPSGLAKINVWVDSDRENLGLRFYGGDLLGNLWRFDHDNRIAPDGKEAMRLAYLTNDADKPQSITTRPSLAEVKYNGAKYPVVYVGTGRYLGTSDLSDATVHSVYAIKDPLKNEPWGEVRDGSSLVKQTITTGVDANGQPTRDSTSAKVDWSSKAGWYADLPDTGERVSVNPRLVLDTLYVGTNVPSSDTCEVGGKSFLYQFDILTGKSTGTFVGNVLVQGITETLSGTSDGPGNVVIYITRSDGGLEKRPGAPTGIAGALRRTSWRELVD